MEPEFVVLFSCHFASSLELKVNGRFTESKKGSPTGLLLSLF